MAVSKAWFPFVEPDPVLQTTTLEPERAPGIYWGQGTPDGDLADVFKVAQKGTIYMQVDATDDDSCWWGKVDEGEDDADWVRFLTSKLGIDIGAATSSSVVLDWDFDATLSSGDQFVGLDIALTMDGTAGSWVSTANFKITNPATNAVSGYYCALELELTNSSATSGAYAPLVLNIIENGQQSLSTAAWIHFRDYGTYEPRFLFWLADVTIGTNSIGNVVMSSGVDKAATHYIRFIAGTGPTTYYIMCTTTAPAAS